MQTYIQKYFDYDTQRLQKGQLALVQLPPPPMLCRHFKPPPHDEPSPGIPNQANETVTKDRHTHDMHKLLAHIDAPSCTRSSSNSSLPEDEKRTPLLEKVTYELEEATETLEEAIKRSQEILKQQDAAKNKITETVELANSVETSIGGEVFQQVSPQVKLSSNALENKCAVELTSDKSATNARGSPHAPHLSCYRYPRLRRRGLGGALLHTKDFFLVFMDWSYVSLLCIDVE